MLVEGDAHVALDRLFSSALDSDSFLGVPLCAGDPLLGILEDVFKGVVHIQRARVRENKPLRWNAGAAKAALSELKLNFSAHQEAQEDAFVLRLKACEIDRAMLQEVATDLPGEVFESPDSFKLLAMVGGRGCLAVT